MTKNVRNLVVAARNVIEASAGTLSPFVETLKELEVALKPFDSHSSLAAPEGNTTYRFRAFKEIIFRFYEWKWGRTPMWDGAEANQLSRLLRADPGLEPRAFASWLRNYGASQDISPGERPAMFLPRISKYSVKPLDRFSRDQDANETESRGASKYAKSEEAISRVLEELYGPDDEDPQGHLPEFPTRR